MSAFDRLIEQIDAFIRKYYRNEMIKGLLLWVGFLLASLLIVSTLEYFGRFDSWIRIVLFYSFLAINGYLFIRYLLFPLLRLFEIGKRIDRRQAAIIIGRFFPNVSDRLLNTLQLADVSNQNDRSFELIRASVVQKSSELTVVPFVDAVRQEEVLKRLKWVLPIVVVFIGILVIAPQWIVEGSSQVVNYNSAQPAPFRFNCNQDGQTVIEGSSVAVEVELSGNYIPENVFVVSERGKFLMKKNRKNKFVFEFENLKTNLNFHFLSEGFESKDFKINVLGKSSIGSINAEVVYPAYLKRKSVRFDNIADLDLPEGSLVKWSIHAKNTKEVDVKWLSKSWSFKGKDFNFSDKYVNSGNLKFTLRNAFTDKLDTNVVRIQVQKDEFPAIIVNESVDSVRKSIRSFSGMISDDYGLKSLVFHYVIKKANGKDIVRTIPVKNCSGVSDQFLFAVDFNRENVELNDKINYHFAISDNDGVNGSKTTRSQSFVYELPTLSELNDKREESNKDLKNDLNNLLKRTEKFQNDVNKLQKSLNSKSKSDFKNIEQVQNLQMQQQQLQQDLQQLNEEMKASNEEMEKLNQQDEELLKQQEMIEKLLEEVMDKELEDLLKQLEELMKKNDQQQLQQNTDKLEQSAEDQKRQMDRTLEMLKKMQVNEKIDALEKELDELAEKQLDLEEKTAEKKLSNEQLKEAQDKLNKEFEELKKDVDELKKLNEELQRPMELGDFEEMKESIEQDMKDAKEKISEGKNSKASSSQKSAAKKMKEMSDQLDAQQQESNQQQQEEDMASIRLLLENLMALSFSQEKNMNGFDRLRNNDPAYRSYGRKQRSIIDDTKIVEDSLLALAKRQPKIAAFVDKELMEINSNFELIVEDIDEHKKRELGQHQQMVMTSYNNLALLLNESLQSMQQQANSQNQQPGSGSCNKPGGKGQKPSKSGEMGAGDMKEMLKQQLEQMKKGKNPGGKDPGNQPGNGNQGMPGLGNQQIAKMAAQQTAIRQRLEQLKNELNKEGQGKGNQLNPLIKELEEQEKALINKKFDQTMIKRQQDILTRLLESEKAIRERGFEERRESKSGKNVPLSNLIRFDEYNRQKLGQMELLKAVDPVLSPYYKGKAAQYFNATN